MNTEKYLNDSEEQDNSQNKTAKDEFTYTAADEEFDAKFFVVGIILVAGFVFMVRAVVYLFKLFS